MTRVEALLDKKEVNNWTILSIDTRPDYKSNCICQCKCGIIKSVNYFEIEKGKSKGCRKCANTRLNKNTGIVNSRMWRTILNGAKDRNIKVLISREEAYELLVKQNFKCALTGMDITIANTISGQNSGKYTASLDRIDSNKDYSMDNIQWTHKDINKMKMQYSMEQFIEFCKMVYLYNKEKNEK